MSETILTCDIGAVPLDLQYYRRPYVCYGDNDCHHQTPTVDGINSALPIIYKE